MMSSYAQRESELYCSPKNFSIRDFFGRAVNPRTDNIVEEAHGTERGLLCDGTIASCVTSQNREIAVKLTRTIHFDGFTFVEMLVAIAVIAMLAANFYGNSM